MLHSSVAEKCCLTTPSLLSRGTRPSQSSTLQVLLDEARTEVNVELHQRRITNRLEAMNLTGLNHKDISRAALEGLAVAGFRVCTCKP